MVENIEVILVVIFGLVGLIYLFRKRKKENIGKTTGHSTKGAT
jgi:hypothetical protein